MILATRHAVTLEGIEPLLEPWTRLRERHGRCVPNNDPGLFCATVRAMRTAPDVTVFLDGTEPRAILIGRRSRRRLMGRAPTRVRSLDVVYGGLITDGSPQAQSAVLGNLGARLHRRSLDHVMINHLPLDDAMARPLLSRRGLAGRSAPRSPHHRFELAPGSGDRTFERFSSKHRYNLRRADRRFVARFDGDVRMNIVSRPTDVAGFIADAVAVNAEAWQGPTCFGSPPVQHARFEYAASQGMLRCYRLIAGGRPVAYQAGLLCGDTFHLLSTAYVSRLRDQSPGHVLLARVVHDLADTGVHMIDYGFGDAPYKRQYGTHVHDESTIYLYGPTVAGQRARAVHGLAGMARRWAVRTGLAGRLRRRRARIAAC